MKCSIIIVTYNGKEVTKILLDELVSELKDLNDVEVIVWDNDSRDGLRELLESYKGNKNWRIFLYKENLGFAKGNNEAAKHADGEYFFLLNPDTEIRAAQIQEMISYLDEHPEVNILGPRLIDEAGVTQESFGKNMTPFSEFIGKFLGSLYLESFSFFRKFKEKRFVRKVPTEVGWVGGAAMIIRRNVWYALGGIDSHFFYSAGDMVDLCKRAKEQFPSGKIVYYPGVAIIHKGSRVAVKNRDWALEKSYESTIYYFKKHSGHFGVLSVKCAFVFSSLVKSVLGLSFSIVKPDPFFDIARSHFKNAMRIISGKIK